MQKESSYSSSAATKPEKSANAQSRKSVSMRACAFFPPSRDPALNGRKRHKDASAYMSVSKVRNGTTDCWRSHHRRSCHTFPPAGPAAAAQLSHTPRQHRQMHPPWCTAVSKAIRRGRPDDVPEVVLYSDPYRVSCERDGDWLC